MIFLARNRPDGLSVFPRKGGKNKRRFRSAAIVFWVADFLGDGYSTLLILSGGVMVAQGPLEALVMVRVHAGQSIFPFPHSVAF